jgi:pyrroline-5-carboxylate reductase
MTQRIGFIGAGNMSRSLAGGLLANGWSREHLLLSDPDPDQRRGAETALGLRTLADNREVAAHSDVLVLGVKPQMLKDAATALAATVQQRRPLVVSVAAVRVMPNTATLIGSGASGLCANAHVTGEQRDLSESILRAVGVVVWVENEALMDVVTAVSGSGPAYFFLVMEMLEGAAVRHGLDPQTARLLTLETAFGAAKMALEGHEEPAQLRRRVTSPGGTTEQAVQVLEQGGIEQLFDQAVAAAIRRAHELADLFGK